MRLLLGLVLAIATATAALAQPRKLLVISVDGLDHRYLKDREQLGLRVPNMRKLVEEGSWADGMTGIVPTVTWPSHTTLITGVRAVSHGILSNRRPAEQGGDYYWTVNLLKAPTLWQVLRQKGRTTAAITWPVTVDAAIDWNLPEYFQRRAGGGMDMASIAAKATPGLVDAIARDFPSFPTEWMDDRSRTLATIHILKHHQPDLTLLHLVDHDSVAHSTGPFSRAALAQVEYTDELIGQMLAAVPKNTVVALVSDHGFEKVSREMNVGAYLAGRGIKNPFLVTQGGYVTTVDSLTAEQLTGAASQPGGCVGRKIPSAELRRFLPEVPTKTQAWEPAPGCFFVGGAVDGEVYPAKDGETGQHGHWPTRYRATFALWGPGIPKQQGPEIDMLQVVDRLAEVLGVPSPRPGGFKLP